MQKRNDKLKCHFDFKTNLVYLPAWERYREKGEIMLVYTAKSIYFVFNIINEK